MKMIPKKIHLIFLGVSKPMPEVFRTCIDRIKLYHPSWEIKLYNDEDANKIIRNHFPYLEDIYNSYTNTVQKTDILRFILVFLYGGFYMDSDMYCNRSLDDLRRFPIVLAEETTLNNEERHKNKLKFKLRIANYTFGSVPKHPIWLLVLEEIIKKSNTRILSEEDIIETTGPGLFTNVYHSFKCKFPEIVLLRNIDRACLRENHEAISCHFGDFAAHLHQGSWRDKNFVNANLITNSAIDISKKEALLNIALELKQSSLYQTS